MDITRIPALERIEEVNMMCSRENPVYEQISNFSVALYVLGCIEASDIMDVHDLDESMASEMLKDSFQEIDESDIPAGYTVTESKDRYLLVIGDTAFPTHFAVVADKQRKRPFYSKLNLLGSGYDSLDELKKQFFTNGDMSHQNFHFYRKV